MTPTVLMIALIAQVQLPTAPISTWDGVAGYEAIRTDEATGEITYPMGQQPADALALGCMFGRSNVRCPKPIVVEEADEKDDPWESAVSPPSEDQADALFDTFFEVFGEMGEARPIDCVFDTPAEGQRRCTFDEAMHNSYLNDPAQAETQEPTPQAPETPRAGCRREEYRDPDGNGFSVRMVCGSGDQRTLDSVREALRPHP